ncbi:MAG: histidine kinase [Clostridiales bacterium]|nr:histidine kinase [Clostridiales bacterium]
MRSLIEKIYRPMNNLKIANKMMLIYVIGGFIPLLLLSFYLTGYTRSILLDQATKEAVTNALRIEERMQDIFRITVDVSDGIYLDDQLHQLVNTRYSKTIKTIEDQNKYTKMDDYLRLYPELDKIRFYANNNTLLDDSQLIPINERHKETDWYKLAMEKDGKISFIYKLDEIKRENQLSMVRLIKDKYGRTLGVLVVSIKDETLRKLMGSEPYEIIGILDNNQIFLSTNSDFEGLYIDNNKNNPKDNQLTESIDIYTDNSKKYKVITNEFITYSSSNHIRLLTIVPIENFIGFANKSIFNSMVLISISVLVALVMVYFLTQKLSDHIEEFRTNLHKVAMGDFEVNYSIQGKDEIGSLFVDLEIMTKSIKDLITKIYDVGVQKEQLTSRQREVEFKMLTSQIDPHFLYNTLETIRMEAVLNDQVEIAQIVKNLASIMRRKLTVSNDEVSLESELSLLTDYLEIQKFRFRERISYSIVRECDTDEFKILPLLLQPIVENAFVHGLEKKVGHGTIQIRVSKTNDFLVISIEDDGVGIDEKQLEALKIKMQQDLLSSGNNIGLSNVYQRIQLYYSTPYHLDIKSNRDIGTVVKLYLPKSHTMPLIGGSDV